MLSKRPIIVNEFWKYDESDDDPVSIYIGPGKDLLRLNSAASSVWLRLDGKHTVKDIIDAVAEEFEIDDREKVKDDILLLLETMEEEGLVCCDWSVFE